MQRSHVTPELKKALTCIEQEQPILRRFSKKEDKITCALTNMVSTGSDILLKFCIINESPFDYEIEDCYFTFNDKRKKKIKAHVRPKKITVPSGEHTYAIFALDRKIAKKGILAIFEEHNGNRHISIQISSRALLNAPRLKHIK